jgi:hypothetical protein
VMHNAYRQVSPRRRVDPYREGESTCPRADHVNESTRDRHVYQLIDSANSFTITPHFDTSDLK